MIQVRQTLKAVQNGDLTVMWIMIDRQTVHLRIDVICLPLLVPPLMEAQVGRCSVGVGKTRQ